MVRRCGRRERRFYGRRFCTCACLPCPYYSRATDEALFCGASAICKEKKCEIPLLWRTVKDIRLNLFPTAVASDRSFLRHCLSRVWCVRRCVRDKIRYSRHASLLYTCRGASILGGDTSRRPLRKRKARRKVRSLPSKKQKISKSPWRTRRHKYGGTRAIDSAVAIFARVRAFYCGVFCPATPARAEARAQVNAVTLESAPASVCAAIGMDIVGTDYRLRKERACECA